VIVVDASAIVDLVSDGRGAQELHARLLGDDDLHAPHVVDVEFAGALRRLVAQGALSDDRAADALLDAFDLPIIHYPHGALIERAWELRGHLTIADGVYVALAEALDAPLVTSDPRLARAGGHRATIEVIGARRPRADSTPG
jgi:predicted nucleic acid-binding protein